VNGYTGSVINSGQIKGGIGLYLSGAAGSVTNSGTITGATAAIVFAGSGANSLILRTGSVLNGNVIGSAATGATNALVLTGSGSANCAFVNFNKLSFQTAGTWTLGGASTIGATTISTGVLAIAGGLTTAISEGALATVTIGANAALTLNGASTLSGTTKGAGTLAITAGATTIASTAKFTVGAWSIEGATASATLGEALTYAGAFSAGSGAVITLSVGALTLTGTAVFTGATTAGSQALIDKAKTMVSGLTIGDAGGFTNLGSLTELWGNVTLGDAQGDATLLTNAATGIWNIADDGGIALGKSTTSSISNLGLFEKTGAGVSAVAPAFANGGNVLVSAGALDFQAAVTGAGSDTIFSAAMLEFDSTVASTQTIDFIGAGGVLDLGSPTGFAGALSGFDTVGSNDSVELLGSWSITGFSTTSIQSTLILSSGAKTESLVFDGSYSKSGFHPLVGSGHTTITYT